MSIGVEVRKKLWGRAGNSCAWDGCPEQLIQDIPSASEGSKSVVIGEEAHIRSSKMGGPRHDPAYGDVDGYENLILMCPTHHTVIDKDNGSGYAVETLVALKASHEATVARSRSDKQKRRQELAERVATAVATWESLAELSSWQDLTFGLNRPVPAITSHRQGVLVDSASWLLARSWPPDFPLVRAAFENLRIIQSALIQHIHESMEGDSSGKFLQTRRDYKKIHGWDPDLYRKLGHEYELLCQITWWLTLKLTEAVNAVIESVREELDPMYRFEGGFVLMHDGDGIIHSRIILTKKPLSEAIAASKFPSLEQIRERIERIAKAEGVDVQELNTYELDLFEA